MGSEKILYDISKILELLPHRYPFLLVDRVLEVELGQRIEVLKNVTMNEQFFQGHFPVEPVMPGVLVLEGMAQAGAILAYLTEPERVGTSLVYFAGLDGVRFRQKVVPGDQLIFDISVLKRKSKLYKLAGKAFVQGKLVAEAILMATLS